MDDASLVQLQEMATKNPTGRIVSSHVAKLNIMTGTSAVTFSPKGETTRAQAATVLIRALQTLGMID